MATNFLINGAEFSDNFIPRDKFTQGGLWCWGYNGYYQFGDGAVLNSAVVPISPNPGKDWKQISVGDMHSGAIKTNGTLWNWGYNSYRLAVGDATNRAEPTQVGANTNWIQVSCGKYISGAVKSDGTLWVWGGNSIPLGNGLSNQLNPTQITGTNWKLISAGGYHFAGIKTDGTLWTWGANYYGENGDGTTTYTFSPNQVPGTNWKLIDTGNYYSAQLGIKTDGTLWSWGRNHNGQLGDGTYTNKSSPVQIYGGGTNWKMAVSFKYHCAGIKTDGTLWTWGANYYGENGDGTTTYTFSPNQVPGTNWKLIDTGNYYSAQLGIKTDGTLWSWGRNHNGQLGDGTYTNKSSPVQIYGGGTNWKMAVSFKYHCAGIKTDGTLWTWGDNTYGQLGDGTTTGRNSPGQIAGTNWKTVGLKDGAMSAIKTDGTLWSWGGGLLGDNTQISKSSPVQIYSGGTNWKMVTGGNYYMLAIRDDF